MNFYQKRNICDFVPVFVAMVIEDSAVLSVQVACEIKEGFMEIFDMALLQLSHGLK